jgi:CubicO group peptidase (beta-lactamase class C family)
MTPENTTTALIQRHVDAGEIAGASALVWRHGRVSNIATAGLRDLEAKLPVERDSIFRIASLTKPITTVAALILLDEGKFDLDDPITGVAPELSSMRVLRDVDGPLDRTDAAARPISFRDLLTHRSGLTYGDFHSGAIARACADDLGPQIDNPLSPDEWIARLARLPLIDQPGAGFHYGHSTDLLGFLISRIEQAPLSTVLERRVFEPLGMVDTGFTVPDGKRHRRAGLCGFDADGRRAALTTAPGGHALAERPDGIRFESGGQGLWSTLDDYLVFARMLIGDRTAGPALLSTKARAVMTTNQLTPAQRASARLFGRAIFERGHGYGMGVAVVMEPEHADPLRCGGGVGTIGWPGAYGSWWQADPNDGSVLIFMSHHMVELHQLMNGIGLGVWSAIAEFHSAASARVGHDV